MRNVVLLHQDRRARRLLHPESQVHLRTLHRSVLVTPPRLTCTAARFLQSSTSPSEPLCEFGQEPSSSVWKGRPYHAWKPSCALCRAFEAGFSVGLKIDTFTTLFFCKAGVPEAIIWKWPGEKNINLQDLYTCNCTIKLRGIRVSAVSAVRGISGLLISICQLSHFCSFLFACFRVLKTEVEPSVTIQRVVGPFFKLRCLEPMLVLAFRCPPVHSQAIRYSERLVISLQHCP